MLIPLRSLGCEPGERAQGNPEGMGKLPNLGVRVGDRSCPGNVVSKGFLSPAGSASLIWGAALLLQPPALSFVLLCPQRAGDNAQLGTGLDGALLALLLSPL